MSIFLRRLYNQKPQQWGPVSEVQSSIFKNAERIGIPAPYVYVPLWDKAGDFPRQYGKSILQPIIANTAIDIAWSSDYLNCSTDGGKYLLQTDAGSIRFPYENTVILRLERKRISTAINNQILFYFRDGATNSRQGIYQYSSNIGITHGINFSGITAISSWADSKPIQNITCFTSKSTILLYNNNELLISQGYSWGDSGAGLNRYGLFDLDGTQRYSTINSYIFYYLHFTEHISLDQSEYIHDNPYALLQRQAPVYYSIASGTFGTNFFDGKIIIRTASSILLDGLAVIKSSANNLLDGKASVTTSAINLFDGKSIIKNIATTLFDGKTTVKSIALDLLDGKTIIANTSINLLDGKGIIKASDTDLLDGKSVIKSSALNLLDGKTNLKNIATNLVDGKVLINAEGFATNLFDGKTTIKSVTTNYLDGLIVIGDIATNLLDGKTIIKSSSTLNFDGKVNIKDIAQNLLDGKTTIKTTAINVLDGKLIVEEVSVGLLDGKLMVKDADTILLDGKVFISSGATTDILDGKIIIEIGINGKVTVSFSMATPAVSFSMEQPNIIFSIK